MREAETGIKFNNLLEINTLELQKIPRSTDNTKKYEWLQFLKVEKEEDFEMIATRNRIIERAYVELMRLSQDEETRLIFESRQKAVMDEASRMRSAEEKGKREGRLEGRQEGRQEGLEQVARQMLENGLDSSTIIQYTALSIEEIETIRQSL